MAVNTIVLLTDFGNRDPYVGIMKGVISRIARNLDLVDLVHQIPPGTTAGLIGSSGLLEISANQSFAADLLGLKRGDQITLSWK